MNPKRAHDWLRGLTAWAPAIALALALHAIAPARLLCQELAASPEAQHGSFHAALTIGAGFADRYVALPTRAGRRELDTDPFPALEIAVRGLFRVSQSASIGAEVRYQTSVGLLASETFQTIREESALRSQSGDAGMLLNLRVADRPAEMTLRVFAGWAIRGLHSTVPIALPSYTLHGPVVRPEFELSNGVVGLRLAPELIAVLGVSSDFRTAGNTSHTGFGIGGEVGVAVFVSKQVELGFTYRESRVFMNSAWSTDATDTERFATVHVALRY